MDATAALAMVHNDQTFEELQLLKQGGNGAFDRLFAVHRERLHRVVSFRLDQRLRSWLDIGVILDDAYSEAARQIQQYIEEPTSTFFVWLRETTLRVLTDVHQRHLKGVATSVSLPPVGTQTTVYSLAALRAECASSAGIAIYAEENARLLDAIDDLDAIDREILVMRHLEELKNHEVAQVLKMSCSAASAQYLRALKSVGNVLD